jgi:hypothetical protein
MGLVPLAKRGEPQGGGNYELWLHSWYKCLCEAVSTHGRDKHKTCPYKVGVATPP